MCLWPSARAQWSFLALAARATYDAFMPQSIERSDMSLQMALLTRQVVFLAQKGTLRSLGNVALEIIALKAAVGEQLRTARKEEHKNKLRSALESLDDLERRVAALYILRKVRNQVVHNPVLSTATTVYVGP